MTPDVLKSDSTADLVQELKRRFADVLEAREQLGFDMDFVYTRPKRTRTVEGSTRGIKPRTTGRGVIAAAQRLRHARRRHASKTEIAQLQHDLEQARAALTGKTETIAYLTRQPQS